MYFWLLVILTSILIICRWHYHHLVTNMGLGEHWLFVWYALHYQWWGRITCVYSDFQLVFFITISSYVAIWLAYLLLPIRISTVMLLASHNALTSFQTCMIRKLWCPYCSEKQIDSNFKWSVLAIEKDNNVIRVVKICCRLTWFHLMNPQHFDHCVDKYPSCQ